MFHLFRLSKKFASERVEYQDFLSKIFCVTVPKTSVGDSFCCINFGYRKSLDRRGVIRTFRRKLFVSQCGKISQGNHFVSQILVTEKVYELEGGGRIKIFRRKTLVAECRETS